MNNVDGMLETWKTATGQLKWYEQRAFLKVFKQAQDEEIELVHGADYSGSGACLVNSASALTSGGRGLPFANYPDVVSLFDQINRHLLKTGVNTDHHVSPLAAEIFIKNFAPLRPVPKHLTDQPTNTDVLSILEQIEKGLPVGSECEPDRVLPDGVSEEPTA